jgi:CRISPR-associated protein Cmr2
MSKAVLRFTFSPVQPFIAEARRTSDLFVGSRILVELANAAARSIADSGGELVFPASVADSQHDAPNVIVAVVPWEQVDDIAQAAEAALRQRWQALADEAKRELSELVPVDPSWEETWHRQTERLWEVYWAAARLDGSYREAFQRAVQGLAATKRLRPFAQVEEPGLKDSLSGARAALRTRDLDAREYWRRVRRRQRARAVIGEHERLDAVGAIKRFSRLTRQETFPSVPTIAARPFLRYAEEHARGQLAAYAESLTALFDAAGVDIASMRRASSETFPYDGAFLFGNVLEPAALAEELGLEAWPERAEPARAAALQALRKLYSAARWPGGPSPYVAVVVLDGDSMGRRIAARLDEEDSAEAHRQFSRRLSEFAAEVRALERSFAHVELVYNGGDDVLALAPAASALDFAHLAAVRFQEVTGGSASAGIAIAHWLQPLGDTLKAARWAEERAKQVDGKAAVCLELRRRSGEITSVRARWEQLDTLDIASLIDLFRADRLSGRLPYALRESARAFAGAGPAFQAELKRVVSRQGEWPEGSAQERDALVGRLAAFAQALEQSKLGGAEELTGWLVVARFLAKGGEE